MLADRARPERQRPDLMDPKAFLATSTYLQGCEANLQDPAANPPPNLAPLLLHAVYGCFSAVSLGTIENSAPCFVVSVAGNEPHHLHPSDYLCLRVGTAFGLSVPDALLSHGMERSEFREAALRAFDLTSADCPLAVERETYIDMLDRAFGLADRIQGNDVDGLFPVTIISGKVVDAASAASAGVSA